MKVYDKVLEKEENVHEVVTQAVEKEITLNEPESFAKIFDPEVEDE